MLEDHRLARVEGRVITETYPRWIGRNSFGNPQGFGNNRIQVRILTTDQGARGWASSNTPDDQVTPLIGERISDLFSPQTGAAEHAYAIDLALHDLAGRILGKPVYELLGASGPRAVPIYTGGIYFDDMEPEDAPRGVHGVVDSCRDDYEAGFRAFKLKIGRGKKWMEPDVGTAQDIAVVRAVREAFPDCRILVDANDAYDGSSFLTFLRGVADCDLYWIEEPFPENQDDLKRLKDEMARLGCSALIAEGEGRTERADPPTRYGGYTERHVNNLFRLARLGLVDVFLLDLGIMGFTRWRNLVPELRAEGVQASPHTWCWHIRPFYVAQLGAGCGGVATVEGIPFGETPMDYSHYRIADGTVLVPDLPGFAMPFRDEP